MHTIYPLPTITFSRFPEIQEERPVALLTSAPAWNAVKDRLHLPVTWQAEVSEATTAAWDQLLPGLQALVAQQPDCVMYAVGGGLVADAAKYLAVHCNLALVCLPTALSVDAFFTWASGIRKEGCVYYLVTKPPEKLVIDLEVIGAAPPGLRAAGICDVLSIATGNWDWRYAEEKGLNPPEMRFIPYASQAAQAILQGALDCAEAAGRGDPQGLKQLLDCLCLEVQLCNQVGHARPEEGSEHYFAYAAENLAGHGLPHGDLLGPGILLMAGLQGQDTADLKRAMEACHIPLDRLSEQVIQQTLAILPDYVRQHNLAYGLAHDLPGGKTS